MLDIRFQSGKSSNLKNKQHIVSLKGLNKIQVNSCNIALDWLDYNFGIDLLCKQYIGLELNCIPMGKLNILLSKKELYCMYLRHHCKNIQQYNLCILQDWLQNMLSMEVDSFDCKSEQKLRNIH